jgi:hypothetical protein
VPTDRRPVLSNLRARGSGAASRASRDKGARIEREMVTRHTELGVKAERVPLSGAAHYRGNGADIDVYAFGPEAAPLVGEVKARGNGEGFATLERWLGDSGILWRLPRMSRRRNDPGRRDDGRAGRSDRNRSAERRTGACRRLARRGDDPIF